VLCGAAVGQLHGSWGSPVRQGDMEAAFNDGDRAPVFDDGELLQHRGKEGKVRHGRIDNRSGQRGAAAL
jgi:hypothetical protein